MRHVWVVAALLVARLVLHGQAPSVLHISVALADATGVPTPVPRHALLISDNPSTAAPRRVLTRADGTVDVTLRPGSYTVESDRPAAFLGKAYQWTAIVQVVSGREATLALNTANAEVLAANAPEAGSAAPAHDPSLDITRWQPSLVTVWSPTSRASGFAVDARGLIATDRRAIGGASSVEVQLSPAVKVPAQVVAADPARDAAIVWVDPSVLSGRAPLPLPCPPASAPPLDDRQEIVALAASPGATSEPESGEVTGFQPRAVETDLRLSFGEAGGPVFNQAGLLVGLTSVSPETDAGRRPDIGVVRVGVVCEALSAAHAKIAGAAPPAPTPLPVEPARGFPADALARAASDTAAPAVPPIVSSDDFDIAFITPPAVARAEQRAGWTGGRSARSEEAEARLGRITDFGAWSPYFADAPAVLVIRVTPKLVEGFWKRLGREAARTQGAVLPAFKDFKTDFVRLRATCGDREITPIHPFVLEQVVSDKKVVREGLYVFDPDALGPQCGGVTLSLYSAKAGEKPGTIAIDPRVIDQVWRDFGPYRDAR